jgi:hypothetical protein
VSVNYVRPVTVKETKDTNITTEVIPSFVSPLKDIVISNEDDNLNYYSPTIKDGKGNYELSITGWKLLPCKCVSVRDMGDNGFNM